MPLDKGRIIQFIAPRANIKWYVYLLKQIESRPENKHLYFEFGPSIFYN